MQGGVDGSRGLSGGNKRRGGDAGMGVKGKDGGTQGR